MNRFPPSRFRIARIFDKTVKSDSSEIMDADSESLPIIGPELLKKFKSRLVLYGYEFVREKDGVEEFKYTKSKSWGLRVMVSAREISFVCPSTRSYNHSLLFEAYQTSSELCDHGELVPLDVRNREWMIA